jgi:hypothetical protein
MSVDAIVKTLAGKHLFKRLFDEQSNEIGHISGRGLHDRARSSNWRTRFPA